MDRLLRQWLHATTARMRFFDGTVEVGATVVVVVAEGAAEPVTADVAVARSGRGGPVSDIFGRCTIVSVLFANIF